MTNRTLQKKLFQTSTILIGLSVMLGALGAHQLKNYLTPAELATFNTALQYQFVHAIGLLILSIGLRRVKEQIAQTSALFFGVGMFIFCGSLYILSIRNSLGLGDGIKWIGALTPIGGLCFIAGWFYLAYNGYKPYKGNQNDNIKPTRSKQTVV